MSIQQHTKKSQKIVKLSNNNYFDIKVASQFINNENSPYEEILKWTKLRNKDEIDLVSGLKFDAIIRKNTYTFWTSELKEKLKKLNNGELPKEIYLCGIDTDCCVLKTAVDIFENNIRPIVIKDFCASNGGIKQHNAGLKVLERLIGKNNIINFADILRSEN
ncbi:isochorismatase family protein [Mycoplasmopsis caviae]|uniref:Isochorismatase family n=1 Tax=Mycoplasmopsis caviae TaxID=55603 RepID=A0A3P8KMD9_9BACT|nr:isochorismatase family protein [Mycoplasmopsis caviae]UUD35257.1 isochorismatase family protein [Mycoplasmopsis caviae]VDR41958.1 Isochorismatase family [Mycoplasmopsis caviae]